MQNISRIRIHLQRTYPGSGSIYTEHIQDSDPFMQNISRIRIHLYRTYPGFGSINAEHIQDSDPFMQNISKIRILIKMGSHKNWFISLPPSPLLKKVSFLPLPVYWVPTEGKVFLMLRGNSKRVFYLIPEQVVILISTKMFSFVVLYWSVFRVSKFLINIFRENFVQATKKWTKTTIFVR